MCFRSNAKHKRAYTLVEMMVAFSLFGIVATLLCSVYGFSTRAFISLANYAELDKVNRTALDTLTKEIRQARIVTDVSANGISIINGDGVSVTYRFDANSKQFIRFANDGSTKVLVPDCNLLKFDVYQRNNIAGTWDQYPAATNDWSQSVKVVRLTWKASRAVPGGPGVSENILTAKIVIRKQH